MPVAEPSPKRTPIRVAVEFARMDGMCFPHHTPAPLPPYTTPLGGSSFKIFGKMSWIYPHMERINATALTSTG